MQIRGIKVSPQAFQRIQIEILDASLEGHGPDEQVRHALRSVGIRPVEGVETHLIVDCSFVGSVYPFLEADQQ